MNMEQDNRPPREGLQGELPIGVIRELTREELMQKTSAVLNQFVGQALVVLYPMVMNEEGKQELGSVPNRPQEKHLLIDAAGQGALIDIIDDNGPFPAFIHGEHLPTPIPVGNGGLTEKSESVIFAQDPFDNTSQYKRRLPTSVFSVISAYQKDGNPIGGAVIDIKAKKAWMSIDGKNTRVTFDLVEETDGANGKKTVAKVVKSEEIFRSQRKTLNDPNATLATFLGEKEYSVPFFIHFSGLIGIFQRKTLIYPEGGAFIYGLLADGSVDAYIMLNEPRTEIDPGLALAKTAGCTIVSVDPETGAYEDYNFDPTRNKNKEDVRFFIAAATPEIRDEIIRYYMEAKANIASQEEKQKLSEKAVRFAASMPREFAVFPDSQK